MYVRETFLHISTITLAWRLVKQNIRMHLTLVDRLYLLTYTTGCPKKTGVHFKCRFHKLNKLFVVGVNEIYKKGEFTYRNT